MPPRCREASSAAGPVPARQTAYPARSRRGGPAPPRSGGTGVRLQVRPGGQGPLAQRPAAVADQQAGVGALLNAEPLASGAPAQRAVEGEMVRIERLETAAAPVAGKVLAEALDLPVRLRLGSSSTWATCSTPRPRSRPLSTASARRLRWLGRTISRSTTTSIWCLRRWSMSGGSLDVVRLAVDAQPHEAASGESRPRASRTSPARAAPAGPSGRAWCLPAEPGSCR